MYVQLRCTRTIDINGEPKTRYPGDWVNVGEQLAKSWMNSGIAWIPPQKVTQLLSSGCGINVVGHVPPSMGSRLQEDSKLGVTEANEPGIPYPQTCIWNPAVPLRPELLPVGFALLDTWQIACPLWDYKELACHMPDEEDKQRTKAIVRDLRIPMYDTRIMWVRRCGDTKALIDTWLAERNGKDDKLAFLRAFYKIKPLMLALPVTWAGKRGPERE